MYGSLFWIEWFDRLDRILTSIRTDLATLSRAVSPRGLAAVERSTRQLSALAHDLKLLDIDVLRGVGNPPGPEQADGLKQALDSTVRQLTNLAGLKDAGDRGDSERMIAAVDSALRDSRYEAAMLLEPRRRRA